MNVADLLLKTTGFQSDFPKFPSGFASLETFANQNFSNFKFAQLCDGLEVYVGDQYNTEPENVALVKEFFEGILFIDNNRDSEFNLSDGDEKLANIKLFASTDGAYLRTQHQNLKGRVTSDEIAVFVELPSGDIFSGGLFCAVVAGENQTKNAATFLQLDWSGITDNAFELHDYQLRGLLRSLKSKPSIWNELWVLAVGIVLQPILEIAQLGTTVFTGIGNLFGQLRISEGYYNPDSPEYKNISISEILKPIIENIDKELRSILDAGSNSKIPEPIRNMITQLFDLSNGISLVLIDIIEGVSEFIIGIVCGVWNSLIDLIVGIFDLVALVFKAVINIVKTAIHANYYWNLLLEYADNFVQYVNKIDWKEVVVSAFKGALKIYDSLSSVPGALLKSLANINFGEYGYYVGYILFEIVQLFFPILEIAKLGKLGKLGKLDDIIKGMGIFSDAKKVSKNVFDFTGRNFKSTIDSILEAFEYFIKKLRGGTASFKKWIDDIFEEIKKWMDDFFTKSGKGTREFEDKLIQAKYGRIYRVQGGSPAPNISKFRFFIKNKKVVIEGDDMLHVIFDDRYRVVQFLTKRGNKAEIFTAEIDIKFIEKIKKDAVSQKRAKEFPNRPQIDDPTKTDNAFGIPKNYFDELISSLKNPHIIK